MLTGKATTETRVSVHGVRLLTGSPDLFKSELLFAANKAMLLWVV